jgi:hypothetical protein
MEPHIPLENFRRGVTRTFLYDLVDEGTSTDTDGSHHFGLIQNNGTAFPIKPAYTSIKNLISILSDAGAAFTPGAMSFNLSGTTADVHTLLLQKRNGNYYLALWVESTNQSASQAVTVTFDQAMSPTAYTYSPCTSATATSVSLASGAVNLTLTTQPTILEVTALSTGTLLVDPLANLNDTSSSLDWTTVAATPTNWLGRTTEAERTAANGSNDLVYHASNISGFTALLGFSWNAASPDSVAYAFSKVELFASPNGTTWTSVPTYVGAIDKSAAVLAQASARWFATVSPAGTLPLGTNYVEFVINSTDGVTLPALFQMNVFSGSSVPIASPTGGSLVISGNTWTYGSSNVYGYDMLENGSWNNSANGAAMFNENGTLISVGGGSGGTYSGDWWSYNGSSSTRIYPTALGSAAVAIAPTGSITIGSNTWSFGAADVYGFEILKNGVWDGNSNGVAVFNSSGTPWSLSGGSGGTYTGSWWSYNGSSWSQIHPTSLP